MPDWVFPLEAARRAPIPAGARSAVLFERGSMKLRFYQPKGVDPQTPHDQDEIYVVVSGRGTFAYGKSEATLERRPFGPGDALFVPAQWVHRFETFSDDFATWVVFWGPKGGESAGG